MNIFVLSLNPSEAAEYHCDKHVVKMILETTQLLYMCWNFYNPDNWRNFIEDKLEQSTTMIEMSKIQKVNFNSYKCGKGHMNHPCSKWLRQSKQNYFWLCNLGLELCKEKAHRWPKNKQHSCFGHLEVLSEIFPQDLPDIPLTQFNLAMPDEYKTDNIVLSYRMYYNMDKRSLFKWTNRSQPEWIK